MAVVSRDLRDVVSLKQQLHWLTGYPRFWQRLLHRSNVLEDSVNLESIVGDVPYQLNEYTLHFLGEYGP